MAIVIVGGDNVDNKNNDYGNYVTVFLFCFCFLVMMIIFLTGMIIMLQLFFSFLLQNYNKSRIHSYRGAKDLVMTLDGTTIFKGEIARASGGIEGGTEAFGDVSWCSSL